MAFTIKMNKFVTSLIIVSLLTLSGAIVYHAKATENITGNVVEGKSDDINSTVLEKKFNSLENRFDELNKSLDEFNLKEIRPRLMVGGGWVYGNLGEYAVGSKCRSWGNAFCKENNDFSIKKLELLCPKNYERMVSGFYTSNPESSEGLESVFICVLKSFSQNNTRLNLN